MPVDAVRQHASAVDTAADRMATARAAAAQVQLGSGAYGQLCSFLPGLIDRLGDQVVLALTESTSALRESAVNLRAAAAGAESADSAASTRVTGAGGRVLPL